MLDRPAIEDWLILAGLRERFGLDVDRLTFDPLGNDSAAWTYRAEASSGGGWFVKRERHVVGAGAPVLRTLILTTPLSRF